MKIAYVTSYDISDSSNWPKQHRGLFGAGYNISRALEAQSVSIDYLGPLERKRSPITRAKWLWYRHLFKKDYYSWAEPLVLKDYARQISRKLSHSRADIVLCPENAVLIAHLKSQRPVVLWTDATIGSLIDFYPYLSNLCRETEKNIYALEKLALDNCQLIILVSDWAAQKAIELYDLPPDKVKVISRGANIKCDRTKEDIDNLIETRSPSPCKLLFIGVDWKRKGGDLALEVTKELNSIGFPTELAVVGCKPITDEPLPSFVKPYGFIDRSEPSGENKINQLLGAAHFLILPTQAETFGIALSEANSFGVPCIATNVGGIPTIIKDGLNGQKFLLTAKSSEYCSYITSVMSSYEAYKKLAMSAFEQYQSRLNWLVGGQTAKKRLQELI